MCRNMTENRIIFLLLLYTYFTEIRGLEVHQIFPLSWTELRSLRATLCRVEHPALQWADNQVC